MSKTVYKETDFSSVDEFASEMFRYGRLYRDNLNTEVIYAKPEDEQGNIIPQFSIVTREKQSQ